MLFDVANNKKYTILFLIQKLHTCMYACMHNSCESREEKEGVGRGW